MKNWLYLALLIMVSFSCKKKVDDVYKGVPVLKTSEVYDIIDIGAKSGGVITGDGGSEITRRGVVIGLQKDPVFNPIYGGGYYSEEKTDVFHVGIFNLLPNTIYHVRAFAENKNGIGYGDDIAFLTSNKFDRSLYATINGDILSCSDYSIFYEENDKFLLICDINDLYNSKFSSFLLTLPSPIDYEEHDLAGTSWESDYYIVCTVLDTISETSFRSRPLVIQSGEIKVNWTPSSSGVQGVFNFIALDTLRNDTVIVEDGFFLTYY